MKKIKLFLTIITLTLVNQVNAQTDNNYTIVDGTIMITPPVTDNSTFLEVPDAWKNTKSKSKRNSGGVKTVTKYMKEFGGLVSVSFDQNGVKQILIPKNKKFPQDLLVKNQIANTRDIGDCPSTNDCLFETQTETGTVLCVVYAPLCGLISLFF